jgi:hypothetical protein
MVDQHEDLEDTIRLTDTVYLVRPIGIPTVSPGVSKKMRIPKLQLADKKKNLN